MFRDRIARQVVPPPSPTAFLLCPVSCLPAQTFAQHQYQLTLYQWALAEAEAVARPSLPELDLLGVWN